MSNDEGMTNLNEKPLLLYSLNIRASFIIRHWCFVIQGVSPASPTLTGVAHGRQALAKLRLLAFGFPLLIGLARLLFGAGARTSAAWQCDKERQNEKCRGRKLFHMKLRAIR
jgi:hypothetical protein